MDTISFVKTRVKYWGGSYISAKILVNREDFKKSLKQYHKNRYLLQQSGWLYKQLTDPLIVTDLYSGYVALFTCTCTVDECGGFFCKVTETDKAILWSSFHTTGNTDFYNSIQELHFDKVSYSTELDKLKVFDSSTR